MNDYTTCGWTLLMKDTKVPPAAAAWQLCGESQHCAAAAVHAWHLCCFAVRSIHASTHSCIFLCLLTDGARRGQLCEDWRSPDLQLHRHVRVPHSIGRCAHQQLGQGPPWLLHMFACPRMHLLSRIHNSRLPAHLCSAITDRACAASRQAHAERQGDAELQAHVPGFARGADD